MVLDTGLEGKILTSAADGGVRWRPGERLESLFEERCDASGGENELAVDGPCGRLTYRELDARANRLARFLAGRLGIRPGDRVGLLFDEAVDGYVGMLAALKAHAVYVPLDPGFPPDRLSYIVSDAGARAVLSHSRLALRVPRLGARKPRRAGEEWPRLRGGRLPCGLPRRGTRPGCRATWRPARAGRGRRAGRRPVLRHLHLRHDRAAEGRGRQPSQHLQLRPGRGGDVRVCRGGPGVPGADDGVRLRRRGDLGAVAGSATLVPKPARRPACSARN